MISPNDLINGSIELIASGFSGINVWKLWKDKVLHGVSWIPTVFFTLWGAWNLFYYPSLGQWLSFTGGISVFLVNAVWLYLVFIYRKNNGHS